MKKKLVISALVFALLIAGKNAQAIVPTCPSVGIFKTGINSVDTIHDLFFRFNVWDIGGTISRTIQAGVKYFLEEDQELIAELVYDGASGSSPGGQGGAYLMTPGTASMDLRAVTSTIADIPAEADAYPSDIKVQDTCIDELAEYRIKTIAQERASLDQLTQNKWAIQYRAQQRSIQAMTDALVLKKAYIDLADVIVNLPEGQYQNYNAAVSTIATRRLLLDSLMALRKRVVAARVRAHAETMEMDLETVPTAPNFAGSGCQVNTGNES